VRKKQFLLAKKSFQSLGIQLLTTSLILSQPFQLGTNTLFENLQSVSAELIIELREVGNGPDGGEDGVVFDGVRFGPEGRYHGNSLGCTKGAEGLVFYISSLQDYGTSLQYLLAKWYQV